MHCVLFLFFPAIKIFSVLKYGWVPTRVEFRKIFRNITRFYYIIYKCNSPTPQVGVPTVFFHSSPSLNVKYNRHWDRREEYVRGVNTSKITDRVLANVTAVKIIRNAVKTAFTANRNVERKWSEFFAIRSLFRWIRTRRV